MRRTVLIVEDVETCASTLEIIFSALDVTVVTATSGEQAWRLLQDGAHDLAAIVTDLEMRGRDGFELIERIRAAGAHRSVPIMGITAASDPTAAEGGGKIGARPCLSNAHTAVLAR